MSEDKKASSSSVGASVGSDSVRNCLQLHDKDNVYTNNSKASFDPKIVNGEDDRDDEEAYGKSRLLSDSPFIVKLCATFPTANRVFFIMEYADLCNFCELYGQDISSLRMTPDFIWLKS
ncbi:unnamed protein product [Caenorhabditis brenneri]